MRSVFAGCLASTRSGLRVPTRDSRDYSMGVGEGQTIFPHIKRIRASYRLSQGQFAALLGISVGTLRNWEQGRRTPEGPARVLLQVAAKHPEAVLDVVSKGKMRLS